MSEPSLSSNVKNYTKVKRLGSGTYGIVHEVLFSGQSASVALKKFKIDEDDNDIPPSTLREISVLKACTHPNILKISDIIYKTNNGTIKIYMSTPVYSHTLKTLCEEKDINDVQIKSIIYQLASGLDYLHTNGFIHRDLKPQNIFVNISFNGNPTAIIGDFGLSRRYYNNPEPLQMSGQVCTLWYKPPELLLGTKNYNTTVDIWSLGMVFAEMLLKKPMCPGISEIDQLYKIFKVLGTPTIKEWETIENLPCYKESFPVWVSSIDSKFKQVGIESDNAALILIKDMLVMDPSKRLPRLIKHSYFSGGVSHHENVTERCSESGSCESSGESSRKSSSGCENSKEAISPFISPFTKYVCDFYRPEEASLQIETMYSNEEQINPDYLVNHPDVNHRMTLILLDWLTDVGVKFKLNNNSFYRCIQIIYKFMGKSTNIPRKNLQLVGVTSLYIASKLEEIYPVEMKDLTRVCDNALSVVDIEDMERKIAKQMDFDFMKPMPIEFCRLYSYAAGFNSEFHSASKFILELALRDINLLSLLPSKLALCVTVKVIELRSVFEADCFPEYTETLTVISKVPHKEIINSEEYKIVDQVISSGCNETSGLWRKYSKRNFGVAAKIFPSHSLQTTTIDNNKT